MRFYNKSSVLQISLLLVLSLLTTASLTSCGKRESPYILMNKFCESYGISDTIFHPAASEWEMGYTGSVFFERIFDGAGEFVEDYAIVFLSSLDTVGECAVFLCYSDYDAIRACSVLRERIALLKSMGGSIDVSYASDAIVFKNGKYAIMCALSDNERAERIWRRIL